MYILHAKVQKGKQNDYCLLLVPCDVEEDRQVVDVVCTKNLFQFECHHCPRIRVVALSSIKSTRNTVDVSKVQLVVFILRTAACEDYNVFWQSLGKLFVIVAALHTTVATAHHDKLADSTTLHSFYNLVGKCKYLRVCKSANNLASFYFLWSLAGFSQCDNFREIFLTIFACCDVLPTWEASRVGCEYSLSIVCILCRRYDTVCSKYDRTIETCKLFLLLPPRIAVVAHKMLVFL